MGVYRVCPTGRPDRNWGLFCAGLVIKISVNQSIIGKLGYTTESRARQNHSTLTPEFRDRTEINKFDKILKYWKLILRVNAASVMSAGKKIWIIIFPTIRNIFKAGHGKRNNMWLLSLLQSKVIASEVCFSITWWRN